MGRRQYWWLDYEEDGEIYLFGALRKDASKEEGERLKFPPVFGIQTYDENNEYHEDYLKIVFRDTTASQIPNLRIRRDYFLWDKSECSKPFATAMSSSKAFAEVFNSHMKIQTSTYSSSSSTPSTPVSPQSSPSSDDEYAQNTLTQATNGEKTAPFVTTSSTRKPERRNTLATTPSAFDFQDPQSTSTPKRGTKNTPAVSVRKPERRNSLASPPSAFDFQDPQSTSTPKRGTKNTPAVSVRKPGKRSLPTDFAAGAIPARVKLPKQINGKGKSKEEQIKEEILDANLGFASISLDCLEISNHQVRPVAEWLVDTIEKGMEDFTDHSYQPYVVLTKGLRDKTKWNPDKACGYQYEVIGGQHNLLASRRMQNKHPDRQIFQSRNCQVYLGSELSFESKAYLGVMNNKVGETRRQSTTKEKLSLCRVLYEQKQKRGESDEEWRKLCLPLTDLKKANRDFGTLTLLAKAPEPLFRKIVMIMGMHEKGQLEGQTQKRSDCEGGLKDTKMYHFRHINSMPAEAAHAVLDLVVAGELPLSKLQDKSKEVEKRMNVQAAIMGELKERGGSITNWKEVETRFPFHMSHDQLVNMFGKLNMTSGVPEPIQKWVTCCLKWEDDVAKEKASPGQCANELTNTQGIKAVLLEGDPRDLDRVAVQGACGFVPGFRQCLIDKPEDWTLEDLRDVVVSVTSYANQARQKAFCLVILCEMYEVEAVAKTIADYKLYPQVDKAYYHVENTTTRGAHSLTESVFGMVIASRSSSPVQWKWTNGSSLNFISVKGDALFKDSDGIVVDKQQKPAELQRELIKAVTQEQEWVLLLCCGVGSGVLACIGEGRNCLAVDNKAENLDHIRGRHNSSRTLERPTKSNSISSEEGAEDLGKGSEEEMDTDNEEVEEEGDKSVPIEDGVGSDDNVEDSNNSLTQV